MLYLNIVNKLHNKNNMSLMIVHMQWTNTYTETYNKNWNSKLVRNNFGCI